MAVGTIVSPPLRTKKTEVLNSVSEKFDVVINFVCRPDCATRCPDTCSNVSLSVSGFQDKFHMKTDRLNKTDALCNVVGGPHPIS